MPSKKVDKSRTYLYDVPADDMGRPLVSHKYNHEATIMTTLSEGHFVIETHEHIAAFFDNDTVVSEDITPTVE